MPCGIVTDPQCTAQLNSRNASFIRCAQIDRPEPDRQGQVRAVHDRSGGNRSLVSEGTTLAGIPALNRIVFHTATLRAYKPIGKA